MYQVYIIYSLKTERYYTGVTRDINRRILQHDAGLNTSTRNKGPWVLAWISMEYPAVEAKKLERKIKKRGADRFLKDPDCFSW